MSGIDFRGFLERNTPHASAPVPSWGWLMVQMLGACLEGLEKVMSDQDTLNQFVADLGTAISAVAAEIQALQAQPAATPLDWSGANAALANLQSLEAPAPAPEPAPAPAPAPAPEPPAGS